MEKHVHITNVSEDQFNQIKKIVEKGKADLTIIEPIKTDTPSLAREDCSDKDGWYWLK